MNVNGYEIKPGANLEGADLYDANLKGACLKGACLKGACLVGAKLEGACLVGAKLAGASVTGTILEKKEVPEDTISLSQKVKKLEEENEKLKSTLKSLKSLIDT
jgi:uncharacterized protein YjbI with pentapeptide repeats